MVKTMETKACRACAIAKRRCGKQTPHCLRCKTRGIKCTYPPTKPGSFVLCREDTTPVECEAFPEKTLQFPAHPSQYLQAGGVGDARLSLGLGLDFSGLSSILIDEQFASGWFASSENWQVGFPATADQSSISVPDLKHFIKRIFRWLEEWVEKGCNSFIHTRLYRARFPRCVQDAYAALSCYFHRTASNEQIALRIIEDRAKNLVAEYDITSGSSNNSTASTTLDPLEHVARVQALLIYQIIGLYDGDIRLRHLSETYLPVLNKWMQEMALHASQTTALGGYLSAQEKTIDSQGSAYDSQRENLLWYSWILAESIRRTWVVGSGIQVVFMALQQKQVDSCQGGMMITTRQGIWEAQSSAAWEKLCLEVHVGLMQMVEVERLFTEFAPSEVNEFTKVALEVVFGRDKMERWGVQTEL